MLGITLRVIRLVPPSSPNLGLYEGFATLLIGIGAVVLLIGIGVAVRGATFRTDNKLAQRVGESMAASFDEGYTLIRNVSKFGLGYIDAVLIGPPGALVFRITDARGNFLNEGDRWLIASGIDAPNEAARWVPARIDPTRECIVDIKALRSYLAKNGLPDVPVYGVVVFTEPDPQARLTLKNPKLPATHMGSLVQRLQPNYLHETRIDPATSTRIVDLLFPV